MFGKRSSSQTVADEPAYDFEPIWQPAQPRQRISVEQLLLERGQINPMQLAEAKAILEKTPGKTITQILLDMSAASESDILSAQAETLGLTFEVPDRATVDIAAFELLPSDFIRRQLASPLRFEGQTLVVGMVDPNNVFLRDEIRRKTGRNIQVVVVAPGDILRLIEAITAEAASDIKVEEIIKDMAEDDVQVVKDAKDDITDLEKIGSESPVIRFVNYLIFDALKQGASDIHIEPKEKQLKVRYRIDGILFEMMNPPHTMHAAIVSRMKIMANLDIAERRLPQDGRIRAVIQNRKIDLRMSTLPT
ncbi:MAG TPA: ATPase, T2SS/T4P/T4SS family, partial [Tepidisphaeraceae bacterium]|nr:ATPase, T2SS/T4P/T4SS family [Tepidisphaeraceae bacterium]